jgi:tetratricopeptide (TPR) repeat protein
MKKMLVLLLSATFCVAALADSSPVRIWEEDVNIPTYQVGPPDPNPLFYSNESYQGAQRKIYPYPMLDNLTHVRADKSYKVVYLENEYIKVSVIPELGGRLFSALDKTDQYNFFYQQHVIKPALIGMLGAWISGGIEWCVFHHHRNTTFMPVDHTIRENPDGSKTVWFGETERRHRMKWLIGITLYPGKSYLEATVKLFNRTPVPNSILYWANVAVHVDEDYQVIFPPSVELATFHSKIDFSHWPISNETYRGVDYRGKDISWWKVHPEGTSFFAWNLQEDFMGGYDHGKKAGVVHVSNHNIVCGAKLWEWGTGPSAKVWDQILTDTDGPYAELMVGAFSDNQPDYSWIKPHEVKTFKQYWYPIREIGGFKKANLDAVVNLELKPGNVALVGFNASSAFPGAKALLQARNQTIFEKVIDLAPDKPFVQDVPVPAGVKETDLRVALKSAEGRELISYQPVPRTNPPLPDTVKVPPAPKDVKTNEELYLTGLRVEQIHNPTVDPLQYYMEAIKRDPGDSRSNIALGIDYVKRGRYDEAIGHLRKAIERISAGYTRPMNTDAYYYLGLALRAQGQTKEAYDNFYRSTWDSAFHSAGYYQLAELSTRAGNYALAAEQVREALETNALDSKALGLQTALLRKLGHLDEAQQAAARMVEADPLDFLARNELYLAQSKAGSQSAGQTLATLRELMRDEVQSYLELATDYMNWGAWPEAIEVLRRPVDSQMKFAATYPLVHYYLGYLYGQTGDPARAAEYYRNASTMPVDYCFAFRFETEEVLRTVLKTNPSDSKAYYYLGDMLYDLQPQKAITYWEKSRELDPGFAPAYRNLGWGYYRALSDIPRAIQSYEQAVARANQDPRWFVELDTLYELGNVDPARRLAALEKNHGVLSDRMESLTREIMVLLLNNKLDQAIDYLTNNFFHVREGGGEIHDIYVDAHLLKGLELMNQKNYRDALMHFEKAAEYPENLSVGRPKNDRRAAEVAYHIGLAHEALGEGEKASEYYRQGAGQQALFRWQEAPFYQGLCLKKLGRDSEAKANFDRLIEAGRRRLTDEGSSDFFAKFGEQETRQARKASAHFLVGLGFLGEGQREQARAEFEQAAQMNQSHLWAKYELSAVK